MVDLGERVAIVTGAGRGIGRAYAMRLAAYGARVIVNDAGCRDRRRATPTEDPAAEVVAEIVAAGGEAVAQRGDIGDAAVGDDARAARTRHLGPTRHRRSTTPGSAGRGWCSTSPTTSGTT